jgi:D-3-phosphoglycerate dehydrogenase
MAFRVLVSAPYMQPVVASFRKVFAEHDVDIVMPPVNERMEEKELLELIEDIDGVICGDDRFTAKVLRAASRLKVISKWGTGIDSIDLETCRELRIDVRNTPDAFSEPVADTVLGYVLCFARKLPWMDREMRRGIWRKMPGHSLRECVLGVIGVGNVGKAVIRRALCFGMRTLGNDLVEVPADFIAETEIEMTSKEDLLRRSDFVSLNCDLNTTSFHLMNRDRFELMKPTAVLINTARGPVVDETALVEALRQKRIAGAALDVFEDEPLPKDNALLGLENVLLAPHNANSSPQAWERVHENTVRNLLQGLGVIEQ